MDGINERDQRTGSTARKVGSPVKSEEIWTYIHSERNAMAETWAGLTAEQWAASSWCQGWSVKVTAGHVLAAAEQTPFKFYKELAAAGFRFNVFVQRAAEKLATLEPDELVRRLRARTTTTNHPPAPVIAMLGEIVVHGQDIRRPLDLDHTTPEEALVALADSWKNTNLLIGAKRRIAGLRLRATDSSWTSGEGPEVSGPLTALVLAMTGRRGALADLQGDGVPVLTGRT
jgi:uncharacterized protein (TIGR03083 family)